MEILKIYGSYLYDSDWEVDHDVEIYARNMPDARRLLQEAAKKMRFSVHKRKGKVLVMGGRLTTNVREGVYFINNQRYGTRRIN